VLACLSRAQDDDDDDDDDKKYADEDQYRGIIKCKACSDMVARVVTMASKITLGDSIKTHKPSSQAKRDRMARAARAQEILEQACDGETGRSRTFCDAAAEQFEDEVLALARANGVADATKYKKPEDICLPNCELRRNVAAQVDAARQQVRRKYQKDLVTEVRELIMNNWVLFFGGLFVSTAVCMVLQLWWMKRRFQRDVVRRRAEMRIAVPKQD
jgi:hypothetical protein